MNFQRSHPEIRSPLVLRDVIFIFVLVGKEEMNVRSRCASLNFRIAIRLREERKCGTKRTSKDERKRSSP